MNALSNDMWPTPDADVAAAMGGLTSRVVSSDSLSPYEHLEQALDRHIAGEKSIFDQYRTLSEQSTDPIVRLVMKLILDDEERHHSLMRQIAARLHDDLTWSHTPDALPTDDAARVSGEELEALRTFVRAEQSGIAELRQFAGDAEGLYQGLPTVLIEAMTLDSQKHELLLRFLYRRTAEALARRA